MLKLSAIALLSAAALLHVTDAHAGIKHSSDFFDACFTEITEANNANKDSNYALVICAEQKQKPLFDKLGKKKLAEVMGDLACFYTADEERDQCVSSRARAAKILVEAEKTPGALQEQFDELILIYQVHKAGYQEQQGKKVAAEAVRQEKAAQAQQVNVYTAQDVRQDPILQDQQNQCKMDYDVQRVTEQARADFNEASRAYQEEMQLLQSYGYSPSQAHQEANEKYMVSARADNASNVQRVKKLLNRCTMQHFGWKQK